MQCPYWCLKNGVNETNYSVESERLERDENITDEKYESERVKE